ncbi:MAG TPA: class I SAM-dependent methyltransferase [Gammaproteobacteria bacterium]|nr:class I SAM-dependent methyltransferase [Gammaproteobacteria bacterium]
MAGIDVFDHFALEYDHWFEEHATEYALELEAVRRLLPPGKGVEIGSGTGRFAAPLGVSLGVEPARAMREIAAERGVNSIAGTAESLPLADNEYDYALFVTTVCFLDSPEAAFREAFRILRPGGSIVVGMIDRDSVLGRQYRQKQARSRFYRDAVFYSVEDVQRDLHAAGFRNMETLQTLLPGHGGEKYVPALKPSIRQGIRPGYGEGSFFVMRGRKAVTETSG